MKEMKEHLKTLQQENAYQKYVIGILRNAYLHGNGYGKIEYDEGITFKNYDPYIYSAPKAKEITQKVIENKGE